MITLNVHRDGARLREDIPFDQISDVLQQEGNLLWADVVDPTPAELSLIGEEFGFHSLAMEDAFKLRQRPKVDFYDGYLFVVFYAMGFSDGRIMTEEIHLFIGGNYLVTIHSGHCAPIVETTARWHEGVEDRGIPGVTLLVYLLLDAIVDGYFPLVDELSDRIDDLEERIFDRFDREAHQEIFKIKKDLLTVRRVLGPQRDVLNALLRRDNPIIHRESLVYFQDVYDHVLRVTDVVDTYRDLLSSALDAYLSVTSNRLNQVMKTLTASSIILMSMTLVASVYGMNFERIPELSWQFGYAWALGLMAVIGGILLTIFRRVDWL